MDASTFILLAADIILLLHVLFVVFVVGGLILIFAGKVLGWYWVRNPWFRTVHFLGIAVVIIQSWFGVICPLTIWEMKLRSLAGDAVYSGTFVSHWLETLLYYEAPAWVFMLIYTVFGGLVAASLYYVRPRPFTKYSKRGMT